MISYSGAILFCTSTPKPFAGRSFMCPIEAFTMKSLPRYLLIVFALAGDSTTTRFFAIKSFPIGNCRLSISLLGALLVCPCARKQKVFVQIARWLNAFLKFVKDDLPQLTQLVNPAFAPTRIRNRQVKQFNQTG